MRILQIVHDFLPHHAAGTEIYTYTLSKELVKRGHYIHLLFTEYDPKHPQYHIRTGNYKGLPYTEVNNKHLYTNFEETYNNPAMDSIFNTVLGEIKPDVVHVQHLLNLSANFVRIAKEKGIPVIFTLHDYWLMCFYGGQRFKGDRGICDPIDLMQCSRCVTLYSGKKTFLRRLIEYFGGTSKVGSLKKYMKGFLNTNKVNKKVFDNSLYRTFRNGTDLLGRKTWYHMVSQRQLYVKKIMENVDLFIAPSQFLRNEYIQFGIPAEKILYSDYGFNISFYHHLSRQKCNPDHIQFSFVGTPVIHKGLHILIQAFQRLNTEKAKLCIYGDMSLFPLYTSYLRMLSDKNKNIDYKGPFENNRISQILSETDALIVPSLWYENSPLVIHEAFLSGVFVIASRLGGIPELVQNGINGSLFKPGDVDDLQKKMKQFMCDYNVLRNRKLDTGWIKTIEKDAEDLEKRYTSFMKNIPDSQKSTMEQTQSPGKRYEQRLRMKSHNLYVSRASSSVGESLVQHKPLEAYIEAASVCNLHCTMCARTFDPRFQPGSDRLGMMSLDTIRLLDGIMPTLLKCYVMGNGEPLTNPKFIDIVSFFKTHFVETSFTTNATLMTPEISEMLVRWEVDSITFSIDGATAQTYEKIRRGAHFEEIISNISRLKEIKQRHNTVRPNMILACVIMTDNIHEITELIKLAKSLGMTHVHFEDLLWQNDPAYSNFYHNHSISPLPYDEVSGFFREALQMGHKLGIKLTSQWFGRLGMDASCMKEPQNKMSGELVCTEPWTTIYVTWNGNILTCCSSEKIFGNLTTQNIYEIWHGNTFEEYRNQMAGYNIPKECGNCLKNGRPKNILPEMEQILSGYRLSIHEDSFL